MKRRAFRIGYALRRDSRVRGNDTKGEAAGMTRRGKQPKWQEKKANLPQRVMPAEAGTQA